MAISKSPPSAHRDVRRVSLRTTLFFETFTLLTLTIICIAVTAFFLALHELNIRTDSQLQTIAQNKAAILESTVIRQREQLASLGQDPDLRSLNSLIELVGFEELLRVASDGNVDIIAGAKTHNLPEDLLQKMITSDATIFRPLLGENGWQQYIISTPQRLGSVRTGTLIAIFDAENLINRLLHADEAGKTAEVLVGVHVQNENVVLRFDERSGSAVPLRDENGGMAVMEEAMQNGEGVVETTDYAGIPVLAAFRSVPTLGWTVVAKIDAYEATAPVLRLAFRIGGIGLMIVVLLSLSTFFLTRRIISPLEELVRKLDGLEARHWTFNRTVTTGDEIETVDIAAADLTSRLQTAHEHLEDIVRDRTEQLRHEHAQDQAILQSMDDGLVVTNSHGIITYMNRVAIVLTGQENGLGKAVTSILPIVTKEGTIITSEDHPVTTVLKTKKRFAPVNDPQYAMERSDGTRTALQIRATPIVRGKKCDGAIAIIRDVSEERRIDRMKSEFISLVSHQLRTPLTSMRWYLEMLITEGESSLNQDQKDWIAEASSSNARMVHLVNALLNVSRIELGKFQLAPETINLKDLVKSIAVTFDEETKKRNIIIDIKTSGEKAGVRSDKGLLQLIVENLIGNAIKYSPEKGLVTVSISLSQNAKEAILTVEDHGIGIPAEQQKDIGRRLFRASNAVKTDTDGNGLGLYISQVAAESVGATLTFTSAENKGTIFTLVIPLDPKQPRT